MTDDPKRIVADGYNTIAPRYLAWSDLDPSPQRMRYLGRLLELLAPAVEVLELGCGAGIPVTRALAESCRVTAVDISAAQIELARQHVPSATLIHADITLLDFPPASFDAVVAFYALIHVPREEQAALLGRIAGWLRPGGLLFVTMGARDDPGSIEPDWLGAPMFWSNFDATTNCELVRRAGFVLLDAEVVAEDEDGEPVSFLWIVARRKEIAMQDSLHALDRTRAELLEAIGRLDEAALDQKGVVGEWSIKNVLAHIAAWEDWVVRALPARLATGATPEDFRARAEDEDRFNAEEVAEREELTPGEQLMELERTRDALLTYVRSLDEATLARRQPWDTWAGTVPEYLVAALGEHEAEHVEQLREVAGKLGK